MTVKYLGNGLELRIEPSFRFEESEEEQRKTKRIHGDGGISYEEKGSDISIYTSGDGKLCLPELASCSLHLREKDKVDIGIKVKGDDASKIFIPIVEFLTSEALKKSEIDWEKKAIYGIQNFDLTPHDFNLENNEHIKVSKNNRNPDTNKFTEDFIVNDLYFFSKNGIESEILNKFWSAYRWIISDEVGKALVHYELDSNFSIYLSFPGSPRFKENFIKSIYEDPKRTFRSHKNYETGKVFYEEIKKKHRITPIDLSSQTIMSLNYGYRMRAIGFDDKTLERSLEEANKFA